MGDILERDGHRVTAVDSGRAALALLAEESFDLALIDIKLGDIDGTEVLASLGRQAPHTTAIMLTGHASLDTAVEALRHGAHDYLFKPCQAVTLRESVARGLAKQRQAQQQQELLNNLARHLSADLASVRALLGQDLVPASDTTADLDRAARQGRFLQHQGLVIDCLRHLATLDGHLLELSPTEFDLLACLVSEAPRVLSPAELAREALGYETEDWEAGETIRAHISHIRRKIKAATGHSTIIRTVRGIGYTIA